MSDYALIVGIDRYDQSLWDIAGPCRNAVTVAQSVIGFIPPQNLFLFLDRRDEKLQSDIDNLIAKGVTLRESVSAVCIEDFCFGSLKQNCPPDSRLFVFWSGHGYVNNNGHRIFICRDYQSECFQNRIFNATLFLRHLLSADFQSFSETLLLADVCGTHPDVKIEDPKQGPSGALRKPRQVVLFATPEGEYARGKDGKGAFTTVASEFLRTIEKWPALTEFLAALDSRLKAAGHTPFRIYAHDGTSQIDQAYGTVSGGFLLESLFPLLNSVSVPEATYQFHYRRAVTRLANPALNRAQGISGMIRELASLQDNHGGAIPFGLLDFLVRLTQVDALKGRIDQWLSENAKSQQSDVRTLQKDLDAENQARTLLVELEQARDSAQIIGFRPLLRNQNGMPVRDEALVHYDVEDWADFEAKIRDLVAALGPDTLSQIHFLTDPPLFDRPFHEIPAPSGCRLGEEFVVLLRYRERLRSVKAHVREPWNNYANALRSFEPRQVKTLPLPSKDGPPIGEERGMAYFTRLLPASTDGTACAMMEKMNVLQLLRLGVPYLCWLSRIEPDDWSKVGDFLAACLGKTNTLDKFPDSFTLERVGGHQFAAGAALLWDDPAQNPFE